MDRQKLRKLNLSPQRLTANDLKKLDSNLKRNTSFGKKIKTINEEQKEAICSELVQLNLTKYLSEIVISLAECKFKVTDVNAVVQVISLLHQRYTE